MSIAALFEGGVDGSCELSFEAANRLASALAFGLFAFEIGPRGRVDASLRDRDPVQGAVELAVAAAVEPVVGACPSWLRAVRRRRVGQVGRLSESVRSVRSRR